MYPVPPKAETAGRTEVALGKWLKTVPRHNVIVATKVHIYSFTVPTAPHFPAELVLLRTETHSPHNNRDRVRAVLRRVPSWWWDRSID